LKYYVIGAGAIGKRHHQNLASLGADVTLLGWRGFDVDEFASQIGQSDSPSALIIATASQVRLELVKLAASANAPIYIEKPLAFRVAELEHIYNAAAPIKSRSMVGFMMRYHPLVRSLASRSCDRTYRFDFEIGHDVRQWRANWRFADSYAAEPEGGGVLLDLCHELDIAHLLFPAAQLQQVNCLGHVDFPGVDVATSITLAQTNGPSGTVSMDYLSPYSLRRAKLRRVGDVRDIDLLNCIEVTADESGESKNQITFERNQMFIDIMRDFMTLAETGQRPDNKIAPVMDQVYGSCKLIAQAWEARAFHGAIDGGMT